jgi:hypothetical protein
VQLRVVLVRHPQIQQAISHVSLICGLDELQMEQGMTCQRIGQIWLPKHYLSFWLE